MGVDDADVHRRQLGLIADCTQCFGLCCVGLSITTSADFAIDKPSGTACPNLLVDYGCGIHPQLRERGFAGCTTYDCFGAGQKISQVIFRGRSWREAPETAQQMFQSLPPLREVHQLLWFLIEALDRSPMDVDELNRAFDQTQVLANAGHGLSWGDVDLHVRSVMELLHRVSAHVRSAARTLPRRSIGTDLRGADLCGQDFSGRDLTNADLRGADLLGTDLRRTRLDGADLTDALFLTQVQLAAAHGNITTVISSPLTRPGHWRAPPSSR